MKPRKIDMARNTLTPNRYYGKVCEKHPEFNGLRKQSHHCVQCSTETTIRAEKIQYEADSNHRKMKIDAAIARNRLRGTRVPPWADISKINEFYKQARELGLTVDHIVPLRGKLVSGLHVQNNLQLLPASVNSSKGNDFPIKEKL